jgi:hypothetical protein
MKLSVCTVFVCLLFAVSTDAAYFTFAGKFTSNRGRIINIPMVGATGCTELTLMTGTQNDGLPHTMQLSPVPVTRRVNTQPKAKTKLMTMNQAVISGTDLRCVKHVAGKVLQTTAGTAMMGAVGGAFTLPDHVWFNPFPKSATPTPFPQPAIEIKYVTAVAQLATSFRVSGPNPLSMVQHRWPCFNHYGGCQYSPDGDYQGGTMANPYNVAPWLKFDKLSKIPVDMRSGRVPGPPGQSGKFTWCPNAPNCVNIASAPAATKAIIKYSGGGNQFGGTMAAVIRSSPGYPSNLALKPAGGPTGPVFFQILAGSGSQPTGRGYAQLVTDYLMDGPKVAHHMEGVVKGQQLITSVMTPLPSGPAGTNFNYGFPFTTMRVIARNTGTDSGNPMATTLSAKGFDKLTSKGGRNIQLVAGGIGITNLLAGGAQTPEIASMALTLPEPSPSVQQLTGALGLLAIAACRARRVR